MSDSLVWSIVLAAALLLLGWGVWRSARARAQHPAPFGPPPRTVADAATTQRVSDLVAAGRTIEAIKALREATGLGLVEAKERVDRWETGAAATEAAVDRTELDAEVLAVRSQHGEIAAMKRLRERTGWGLADAKAYLDGLGRG
ncbi:ribosomal protein L7/L12 [Aeromicrobium sp. Leaf350]|uniref:ribosomal protein L7/L12 n=1 Tax=Aeromicrobium sp. Leaf350 TaxID=2876565 RepID=UPI001E2FF897|nr:ribosomal protein L7/L12 [Aeromicrobium sp. Leaf350]